MIESMKQVAVVCARSARSETVARLRDLGIVHVRQVREPASAELDATRSALDRAERALGILRERPAATPGDAPAAAPTTVAEILDTDKIRTDAAERLAHWTRCREQLQPWGSIRRNVLEAVHAAGLDIVLASAHATELPTLPDGAVFHEISRQDKTVYFAVVAPAGTDLELTPAPIPEVTDLDAIETEIRNCREALGQAEARLDASAVHVADLGTERDRLHRELEFFEARDGMGRSAALDYLTGFVPASALPPLRQAARQFGWALHVTEPAADDMGVPTKLTLPRWAQPIRTVFAGLGILPGYREVDISACFLVFFSIFFAILIGDAGYGALILLATFGLRRRFPAAPAQPFRLFGILGVATIIWGILTANYFGIVLPPGSALRQLPTVSFLTDTRNGIGDRHMQHLCFLLGAIHLTLAHLWNAVIIGRRLKALSELGWVLVLWGNYLLALSVVLGQPRSGAMLPLYGAGVAAIMLFSAPQPHLLKAIGGGAGALGMNAVNSFVDLVSYVRLFAVGAASLKVAQSFNEMAFGMDLPPWLAAAVVPLVLVFGHGLNVMLGAMGVLVHGVRLNVLEFSGHIGLQWSGVPYRPLRSGNAAESPS